MDEQNREWLKQGNLVIHLRIRAETVVERLMNRQGGRERPLLKAPDPLRRVQELMAEREPAYAKAQVSIDTEGRGSQDVVAHITRQWLTWRRSRAPANPAAHATSAAG